LQQTYESGFFHYGAARSDGLACRLPAQLAHQRACRMAEQLVYRSRIELIDALEFLGMDAAGEEKTIDPETERAGEVGAHRISDRQYTVERGWPAAALGGERHGAFIDRPVRLAVEDRLAAEFAIELRDRARAIDQAGRPFQRGCPGV